MSAQNCKVAYIRPRYKNLREWTEDKNNVYVGRAGVVFIDKQRFPKVASPFANPFKISKDCTREQVVEKYRAYITERLNGDAELLAELLALKGKNLGCWCAPELCHADVLLELIDFYSKK